MQFINFLAISWREQVNSMRWWWGPLCARPTGL